MLYIYIPSIHIYIYTHSLYVYAIDVYSIYIYMQNPTLYIYIYYYCISYTIYEHGSPGHHSSERQALDLMKQTVRL